MKIGKVEIKTIKTTKYLLEEGVDFSTSDVAPFVSSTNTLTKEFRDAFGLENNGKITWSGCVKDGQCEILFEQELYN